MLCPRSVRTGALPARSALPVADCQPYVPRGFLRESGQVRGAAKQKAVTAAGFHLFPFRTEKLSPPAPMVLRKRESRLPPPFMEPPGNHVRFSGGFFCCLVRDGCPVPPFRHPPAPVALGVLPASRRRDAVRHVCSPPLPYAGTCRGKGNAVSREKRYAMLSGRSAHFVF